MDEFDMKKNYSTHRRQRKEKFIKNLCASRAVRFDFISNFYRFRAKRADNRKNRAAELVDEQFDENRARDDSRNEFDGRPSCGSANGRLAGGEREDERERALSFF
jgi:hypothetical protein